MSRGVDHEIDVIGPAPVNHSGQARADKGFAAAPFAIDWQAQQATGPAGNTRVQWLRREREGDPTTIQIKFAKADCAACPVRADCTKSVGQARILLIRDQDPYEALQVARERQQTEVFQQQYRRRAGIEGTISQGVQMGDVRRSRDRGEAKTRLLHLLIAAALNFMRVAACLAEIPRARTRQSAFARLVGIVNSPEPAAYSFASSILTKGYIIGDVGKHTRQRIGLVLCRNNYTNAPATFSLSAIIGSNTSVENGGLRS